MYLSLRAKMDYIFFLQVFDLDTPLRLVTLKVSELLVLSCEISNDISYLGKVLTKNILRLFSIQDAIFEGFILKGIQKSTG